MVANDKGQTVPHQRGDQGAMVAGNFGIHQIQDNARIVRRIFIQNGMNH